MVIIANLICGSKYGNIYSLQIILSNRISAAYDRDKKLLLNSALLLPFAEICHLTPVIGI